jgi:hypothetical protein
MSQPMEHRTITANQARAEYAVKCNEVIEIELVIDLLDQQIGNCMNRAEPLVAVSNDGSTIFTTDAFWLLLDLHREACDRRLDLYAARDYAYAVWKSASPESIAVDTHVSTLLNHR